MRLFLCVLLFGLALVGQCVRMKSQLLNHAMLQNKADGETVDVWFAFGEKVGPKKMKTYNWVTQGGSLGWNARFNHRYEGEIIPEAAICIHDFPEAFVVYLAAMEEEMFDYLLSLDSDNNILSYWGVSKQKGITNLQNTIARVKITKPSDFLFEVKDDASFYVASEYYFEGNNLQRSENNMEQDRFTKAFENVWRIFWTDTYNNEAQWKQWLLLAYAYK
eukprot:Platyproteum_vivax@DN11076_c0_g1_i1.p1